MNKKLIKAKKGFSLVELSVVLVVIGITLGGALDIATRKTEADKIYETESKIETIEKMIAQSLNVENRLPCPANAATSFSDANFGTDGTASTSGCTNSNFNSSNAYAGTIPINFLSLPEDYMFDAWGRRLTYIVDYRLANSDTTNPLCDGSSSGNFSLCFRYTDNGSIIINDASSNIRSNQVAYVIISHGKNGSGAWNYTGTARLAVSSDADEKSNGDTNGDFDNIFVQKEDDGNFDDIVSYKLKWQIIDSAGGITDEHLCDTATDDPLNKACSGASDATICQNLANNLSNFCFN